MTIPAKPIRLYRHALSGHAHRVELFLSLLGLIGFVVVLSFGLVALVRRSVDVPEMTAS